MIFFMLHNFDGQGTKEELDIFQNNALRYIFVDTNVYCICMIKKIIRNANIVIIQILFFHVFASYYCVRLLIFTLLFYSHADIKCFYAAAKKREGEREIERERERERRIFIRHQKALYHSS